MTSPSESMNSASGAATSAQPVAVAWPRFVTAASLFDGHDAAINVMRRMLQASGAEVIHLAHNRSVLEVVEAAVQEDVQAIAISSYQGGHIEYFQYMIDSLRARGAGHIKVFGGGGGVIIPAEIAQLHEYGVNRIYSPEDGQRMGLQGMIDEMLTQTRNAGLAAGVKDCTALAAGDRNVLARVITLLEYEQCSETLLQQIRKSAQLRGGQTPVLGITGTGGAGKSSLTDELIRRLRQDAGDSLQIAVLAIDPTRRKTGGALLGDRVRMNAIYHDSIYMRSIATRKASTEVPAAMADIIAAVKVSGFDLIIVETPGIGQGDAGIVPFVDAALYVMTPEFGAASQLEKIDMLDFADVVAINKFDRKGAEDALRDVSKQIQRNRQAFAERVESMPVYGTIAAKFNDDGVTALYQGLVPVLRTQGLKQFEHRLARVSTRTSSSKAAIVPPQRQRYLAEIAETSRNYRRQAEQQSQIARQRQQLLASAEMLAQHSGAATVGVEALHSLAAAREQQLHADSLRLLQQWPEDKARYSEDELVVRSRDKEIRTQLATTTLSGTQVRKVALPRTEEHGELLRWLLLENLPGRFPYTAGVFEFKREGEDPTRMFAGEGDAFRTNRRFKALSAHAPAKRLSTAFDSVTLYGFDPDERPDIYGKVGNSGVSIATLDDMKVLYEGFDLCSPDTSVSMTINGPAPTILAMFLNTAIEQQLEQFRQAQQREPEPAEEADIRAHTLASVRGTVQADILKEDQGQNTCIFSTEFSLKLMGDIQEYFIANKVRNFYSVSISGYHIAEAGANPISQLAFTLSNGFTFVEAYLARGMAIDDFAPNLSFFFSNGMDAEYTVLGRVARRIWATVMREKYGANERSQKLKYHIQTSGRSLHAQEMAFNDIRTTLQALIAIYDNCNSLHTNAYDEAITTPTDESVRRAMAIQLVINKEWGLARNENPNQGAFIIDELTDLVEEAVLQEFERISERGGVLGAMETGYQRGRIQDESLYYEHKKHDGSLPIIGVNTFLPEQESTQGEQPFTLALARSTEAEKQSQIKRLREFQAQHAAAAEQALARLKQAAIHDENVFAELMEAVRHCSLGQITEAFFEVGGQYRRNM
ncbi:MAG: methylmalonyl-CoA mutase family protein [Pseudomonadales bacterium]|nr:methylmalonyl-CoA mutase family protein [Pseudomonadales bacterium]